MIKYKLKEFIRGGLETLKEIKVIFLEAVAANKIKGANKNKLLESRILVAAHSLEKGMGCKVVKKGYGVKKANNLLNYLENYKKKAASTNTYTFIEAVKVLKVYIAFHEADGFDISQVKSRYESLCANVDVVTKTSIEGCMAGYDLVNAKQLDGCDMDFDKFISQRRSIRDYKEDIVSKDKIAEAVRLANKAPSACNRQPVKVYTTSNSEQVRHIDNIITGTSGFKGTIPNVAIITCDRSYFSGAEYNQWYINGGIYLSYFVLSLHSLGIGSCIMQWFAFYKTEKELKKYFGISSSEAIIAVVGYGYYKDETKCICAQRKSVDETLTII